ncbi:MAG: hypothetical protein IBX46_12115 [Desulfuromonadales bacterium]|nr:hypothetical protein [Desulfuromonadales bacterium]
MRIVFSGVLGDFLPMFQVMSVHLPQNPKSVIPEAIQIGNPASHRPKHGSPIKTFGDDKLIPEDWQLFSMAIFMGSMVQRILFLENKP